MPYKNDYEWIEHVLTVLKLLDDIVQNTSPGSNVMGELVIARGKLIAAIYFAAGDMTGEIHA